MDYNQQASIKKREWIGVIVSWWEKLKGDKNQRKSENLKEKLRMKRFIDNRFLLTLSQIE